jgi:hypothetical protein
MQHSLVETYYQSLHAGHPPIMPLVVKYGAWAETATSEMP